MLAKRARSLLLILLLHLTVCAQKPELVVQKGHAEDIYTAAFSPDERLLASGSMDTWVLLWDVRNGRLLRRLGQHAAKVMSVKFSPEGSTLASGSLDRTIKLWDVKTGELLRTFQSRYAIEHLGYSADGRTIVSEGETAANEYAVELWDVATGRLRSSFGLTPIRELAIPLGAVALSPDGATVAALGYDGGLRFWSAGQPDAPIRLIDLLATQPGYEAQGVFLSFSPNNRLIATALSGVDGTRVKLWDAQTGRGLREFKVRAGYDVNDDGAVRWDKAGDLLTVGNTVFEVGSGRTVRVLNIAPDDILSPGGSVAASIKVGTTDNPRGRYDTIQVKDVTSGAIINRLQGLTEAVSSISFADDGKKLVVEADETANVRVWDTHGGGLVGAYKNECGAGCALSSDGTLRAKLTSPRVIKISERAGNRLVRTLNVGGRGQVEGLTPELFFSSDNQRLLVVSRVETEANESGESGVGGAVDVYDLRNGRALAGLRGQVVAVSPGAKLIALADRVAQTPADMRLRLFDGQTGKLLKQIEAKRNKTEGGSLAFSPDGDQLVWSDGTQTEVYAVATGALGYELRGQFIGFGADGQTIETTDREAGRVDVWARESGRLVRGFEGLQSVTAAVTTPDGRSLLVGTGDSRITFWSLASGELLGTLFILKEGNWLAATPDGLFDGSPASWNQMLWRFSRALEDVAPAEVFFNDFYYPELLPALLAGERPRPASGIEQKDRRQPQLTLKLAGQSSAAQSLSTRKVPLTLTITQAEAGAQDVRLFRNGSLVKVWRGDALRGQEHATLDATVTLVAGENRFTAYAFNRDNIKSADAALTLTGAASLRRTGTAYVLTVGINEYANSEYNLRYAVADAQAFGTEVKRQQERLGRYASVEIVPLFDQEATKQNVLGKLSSLAAAVQPEDELIVYYAGHGTAHQNQFYLLPHDLGYEGARAQLDEGGLERILAHGISDRELESAFAQMDAGRLIFVMDACNSGQALEAEEKRRGPMNSKGLAQLAYEKGMYVLAAAQSFQAAQEAATLGHGLLTYALVTEGLGQGKADRAPSDGQISVREWLDYATGRVPDMQLDKMKAAHGRGLNLSFAEDERALAVEKRSGQRPRVFYRRELEARPLVIARPSASPSLEPSGTGRDKPSRTRKRREPVR